MQLIVDEMLKNLVKWLRIFGVDTLYFQGKTDTELLAYAQWHKNIIITKDRELALRATGRKIKVILLKGEDEIEQLRQISNALEIDFTFPKHTRCPLCNTKLSIVKKETVAAIVPTNINRGGFWFCSHCNKAYWEGSHWKRITERFKAVRQD